MVYLACQSCGHIWDFSGSGDDYGRATCPDCGSKVPVEDMTVRQLDSLHEGLREGQERLAGKASNAAQKAKKAQKSAESVEERMNHLDGRIDDLESEIGDLKEILRFIAENVDDSNN